MTDDIHVRLDEADERVLAEVRELLDVEPTSTDAFVLRVALHCYAARLRSEARELDAV